VLYDILGRLTNATVSLSVPEMTAVQYALEYQYDAAGNVTSRTLRGVQGFTQVLTNSYEYDAMNRLVLVTNPDTGIGTSYTYENGRLPASQVFLLRFAFASTLARVRRRRALRRMKPVASVWPRRKHHRALFARFAQRPVVVCPRLAPN
jgi:hypothetical protein